MVVTELILNGPLKASPSLLESTLIMGPLAFSLVLVMVMAILRWQFIPQATAGMRQFSDLYIETLHHSITKEADVETMRRILQPLYVWCLENPDLQKDLLEQLEPVPARCFQLFCYEKRKEIFRNAEDQANQIKSDMLCVRRANLYLAGKRRQDEVTSLIDILDAQAKSAENEVPSNLFDKPEQE
ncbi:MAG: hypothetical protein R3B53_00120 [Candidatus Paceibacterota bacterium]